MDRFGPDEETLNRLGKAYTELGQLSDATEAYKGTLKMNPVNPIAVKNLGKLQAMRGGQPVPTSKTKVDVDAFIEETGKTSLTALHVHGEGDPCSKVAGGDPVKLIVAGDTMNVETARGVYLGHLDPALGRRLIKFLEGGNRYSGAVATSSGPTPRSRCSPGTPTPRKPRRTAMNRGRARRHAYRGVGRRRGRS